VGELHGRLVGHQWRVGTDLSEGGIKLTDRPLDFALQGDGFFVVRAPTGTEFLTRNGSFEITPDGTLLSAGGYEVMGENSEPLQIPPGLSVNKLEVNEDGELSIEGRRIGRLQIERVESEKQLRRVGTTMFAAAAEARSVDEETRVLGKSLEGSNTVIYQELADMMVLTRAVEAAQKAQSNETESQKKMMDSLA
jgi:flagellar basal-body rod protein FlgF